MSRTADYTLKGFIYQFNKTLLELLKKPEGSEIEVEGIIEDIDIKLKSGIEAIQCKYHEKKNKYVLSDIAKPILQMLIHFVNNKFENIKYILFAYFSAEKEREEKLTKSDIEIIINTTNSEYISKYIHFLKPPTDNTIKKLVAKKSKNANDKKQITNYYKNNPTLPLCFDIDDFLKQDKFRFEIGKSFKDLIICVKDLLKKEQSFSAEDVDDIIYPNSIQHIADLSIEHDKTKRKVEKKEFLNNLEKTKKTAITRWTKELLTFNKLLKKRREQLTDNLKKNSRLRYFIIKDANISDFQDKIVNFISDYIDIYNSKIKLHNETPLFCIDTKNMNLISEIESRLYKKNISSETGIKGSLFFQKAFLREPERKLTKNWIEFKLRLALYSNDIIKSINSKKCDDLFIISKEKYKKIEKQDINRELLEVDNFNHLRYLLKLTNTIND